MSSPDDAVLFSILQINKEESTSVYVQIAQQIINAVQRNIIAVGSPLPGSRTLSKHLQIHRNTVVAAYEELASQGWVEIKPNKGTFVLYPQNQKPKFLQQSTKWNAVYPKETGFRFHQSNHLNSPYEITNTNYYFNDGQPDIRLLPATKISSWYTASMKRKSVLKKWNAVNNESISYFEKQLCNYLNSTRRLHILPQNILTTRSTEMSLYIISQLMIQPNDVVLVGSLSNFAANMIFHQAGAKLKTIPVDKDGIDVSYIRKHFVKKSIRCLYCTPHRHYPTTHLLSAERRLELLELAKEYEFAIIEDDFDYDFQYDISPMMPMASADTNGMIIYLGRFGQSLLPAFQTGFVVAPENLIKAAKNYRQMIDKQGDLVLEQVLADMIHEGEIHRLLKKSIVVYKQRRDLFCKQLELVFGNKISWQKPLGGLAIWIQFNPTISLTKFAEEALKIDLTIPKNILYQDKQNCAIRLGFGHLNDEEIVLLISKLKEAYDSTLASS